MEIILLERVAKLGAMGDVVKVKNGFARNYLLRRNKALRANAANKAKFDSERAELEARNAERCAHAAKDSTKLEGKSFIILRQAGESGQLYGSVSTRDIAEAVSAETGIAVSRQHVLLKTPIKTIGICPVDISLHPEISTPISVNIARSADEAAAQARGEILTGPASDRAEIRAAAEALFEEDGDEDSDDGADDEKSPTSEHTS